MSAQHDVAIIALLETSLENVPAIEMRAINLASCYWLDHQSVSGKIAL
jgi:hypothetical protein